MAGALPNIGYHTYLQERINKGKKCGCFWSWSLWGYSEPASQARGLAWILEPGPLPLSTPQSTLHPTISPSYSFSQYLLIRRLLTVSPTCLCLIYIIFGKRRVEKLTRRKQTNQKSDCVSLTKKDFAKTQTKKTNKPDRAGRARSRQRTGRKSWLLSSLSTNPLRPNPTLLEVFDAESQIGLTTNHVATTSHNLLLQGGNFQGVAKTLTKIMK